MKILALEASRTPCALAAVEIDTQTNEIANIEIGVLKDGRALAEELINLTDVILSRASWQLQDVDALAIGIGPGSWTGLRIALSTWKTLSQTRDIPLIGVPSFDALAQAAWRTDQGDQNSLYLACAPCRPGVAYGKIFEAHPDYFVIAQDEWIDTPGNLIDALMTQALARDIETSLLVVGALDGDDEDGEKTMGSVLWKEIGAILEDNTHETVITLIDIQNATVEIALAAWSRLQSGEADDAVSLQPLYLAPSAAERNRDLPLSQS